MEPRNGLEVAVLGLPRASASATFGILDVLSSVGRDWEALHGLPRRAPFLPRLVSPDGAAFLDANGRLVQPDASCADVPAPDIVIVPHLYLPKTGPLPNHLAPAADYLRQVHEAGGLVTSVCSGTLLVAQAGLLDGAEAATHWGYYEVMARLFPQVRIRRERILVPAGRGHRIITSGGTAAWGELLLYLIARLVSPTDAAHVSRLYLLRPAAEADLRYAVLAAGRNHGDVLVAEAQVWVATNYVEPNPVAGMAARVGLHERSLHRRFRRATGQSPLAYVQTVRIEEAKQLLETSDAPIEEIAAEVGYGEASSFRALFRRQVGVTASEYRRARRSPTVKPLVAA